jgi:hypothetical protein
MTEAVDEFMATVTEAGVSTLASVLPLIDDAVLARINAIADLQQRCNELHQQCLQILPIDADTAGGAVASAGILIACARWADEQEAAR